MGATSNRLKSLIYHKKITGLVLILSTATLFAVRYLPAFTQANFYAEDGTVFIQTIQSKGYAAAAVEPFNGYFVMGQYLIASAALALHTILGLDFYQLPRVIAAVSCVFMGMVFSLPYFLFRKQLGLILSLFAVLFGVLMPMVGSDYAIVGVIGNTKFAFLYVAFLLLLYRNSIHNNIRRTVAVDSVVLLCVLTNVTVLLLLPFAFWPYRQGIGRLFSRKDTRVLSDKGIWSLIVLMCVTVLYVGVTVVKGVPTLAGYLDSPYKVQATLKLLYRVTLYVWTYPLAPFLRGWMVVIALIALCWISGSKKENRYVLLFGLWAIFSSTAVFVVNRPGISDYYMKFEIKTTDQFFYAQTLIFMFVTLWVLASYMKRWSEVSKRVGLVCLIIVGGIYFSLGSSHGRNADIYNAIGSAESATKKACARPGDIIQLSLYPAANWRWGIPRHTACQ